MARSAALNPASTPFFPGGLQQQIHQLQQQQRNAEDTDDSGASSPHAGVNTNTNANANSGTSTPQFTTNTNQPYFSFQQGMRTDQQRDDRRSSSSHSAISASSDYLSMTSSPSPPLQKQQQQQHYHQLYQQNQQSPFINSNSSANTSTSTIHNTTSPPPGTTSPHHHHPQQQQGQNHHQQPHQAQTQHQIKLMMSLVEGRSQMSPSPRDRDAAHRGDAPQRHSPSVNGPGQRHSPSIMAQQQRQSPTMRHQSPVTGGMGMGSMGMGLGGMGLGGMGGGDAHKFNSMLGGDVGPLTRLREPSMLGVSSLGTLPEGDYEQNQTPSPTDDEQRDGGAFGKGRRREGGEGEDDGDGDGEGEGEEGGSRTGYHTPSSAFYTHAQQGSQHQNQSQNQYQHTQSSGQDYYLQQSQYDRRPSFNMAQTPTNATHGGGQFAQMQLQQTSTSPVSSQDSASVHSRGTSASVDRDRSMSTTYSSTSNSNSTSYSTSSPSVDPLSAGPLNVGSHNVGSPSVGSHNVGSHNVGSHNVGSHNVGSHNVGSLGGPLGGPQQSSVDRAFEEQLRNSVQFRAVLDRLGRVEYTTREIQRDLGDLGKKVNILVERALAGVHPLGGGGGGLGVGGLGGGGGLGVNGGQPEFKDPFASNSANSITTQQQLSQLGHNRSPHHLGPSPVSNNPSPASLAPLQPRPSMGNIAPNQVIPNQAGVFNQANNNGGGTGNDEISTISARLNTLTSSVGQLLALQTQQLQHSTSPIGFNQNQNNHQNHSNLNHQNLNLNQQSLNQQNLNLNQQNHNMLSVSGLPETLSRNNSVVALNTTQMDLAPNQMMPERSGSVSVHGLGGRGELGMRASVASGMGVGMGLPGGGSGGMGLTRGSNPPMRTWSAGNLDLPTLRTGEQGMRQEALLRDKRRSVSGLLRRDSAGVIDPSGENWGGRDGPVISKWEQLTLAPELLRSLGKFGIGPPNKIQQRALPFLLKGADIIAQAPPTQERIAAYVIPAIQVAVTHMGTRPNRGPLVIMVSTTVDQATQAQRMIRDLGGPIGVRSALGVGISTAGSDLAQELRLLQQNMPHIICGTPQKLHALFTNPGGLIGSEVRFLVLDEVDQLIARNLHDFVFNIVKLLPPPRSRPLSTSSSSNTTPNTAASTASTTTTTNATSPLQPAASGLQQNGNSQMQFTSPFEPGNPVISPFAGNGQGQGQGARRFSTAVSPNSMDVTTPTIGTGANGNTGNNGANGNAGVGANANTNANSNGIERQTALFSNTVPQDVLNLANAIQLREPVRVLVRRDGNGTNPETSQGTRGLRQFYLYLAFTAGSRSDPLAASAGGGGLGIIGSGRGATSAETTQAREWKLDALADMFEDLEVGQAIVHVGGMTSLDSVVYKLASRGLEAIPLHGDMNAVTKVAALNKFRTPSSSVLRQASAKVLVIYDVQLKNSEVPHVPLVLNYDLPKAVEEYAHRVSPAIASNYSRAGVVVNFVTATGGDVEMLRSIECFYKIKCPEVPVNLRDIV